jgi:Domain of unknown function (DUF4430)
MYCKKLFALGAAAVIAVAALSAGSAAAAGTKVTVRVEGKERTLLAPTVVQTHSGWITKGGVASGKCSASSGQGALDVATHHRWGGTFSTSFGSYFIKSILGETDNGPKYYWSIFVNDRYATTGACGLKLHPGDVLLFAAATYPEYPIGIEAPSTATVGHTFDVTVVWWGAKGKPKPLAGATLSVGGHSGTTNSHGVVPLTPSHTGSFVLTATHAGYIRAAQVQLRVTA